MPDWCPKCHAMLAEGQEVCPACGAKLGQAGGSNIGLKEFVSISAYLIGIALIPVLVMVAIGLICVLMVS